MSIPDVLAKLTRRLAEVERRQENMIRNGVVREVDAGTQRVRLAIGKGPDGTEHLSPWVPYGQQAGALKIHATPSPGQNMTLVSPGGSLEQAMALPMTWNDGNPSPSSSADEVVMTFGDVRIVTTADGVTVTIGGNSLTMTADGTTFTIGGHTVDLDGSGTTFGGGRVDHDGRNIGKDHLHTRVRPGPALSGPPR